MAVMLAAVLAAGCSLGGGEPHLTPDLPLLPPTTGSVEAVISLAPEDVPSTTTTTTTEDGSAADESDQVDLVHTLFPVVVRQLNHDPSAYTQGLEYFEGRLFESTGAPSGRSSTIRELDAASGGAMRSEQIDDLYTEGITFVDGSLIQITWRDGVAIVRDPDDFSELTRYSYEGEGWGICYDGRRLVMSDGSDELHFRDPDTFERAGNPVSVTLRGEALPALNELECVDGRVWANVWKTDLLVEIDLVTGEVLTLIDASQLGKPRPSDPDSVLNGIAYNPESDTFLLAGKDWPTMFEVRFLPIDEVDEAEGAESDESNREEEATEEATEEENPEVDESTERDDSN